MESRRYMGRTAQTAVGGGRAPTRTSRAEIGAARLLVVAGSFALAGCAGARLQGANLGESQQSCIESALRRDPDEETLPDAARRFEESCRAGEDASCSALGVMNELGRGVPRNAARAVALYRRACDRGNDRACVNLGAAMLRGDGVARDGRRAEQLFSGACAREEMSGCAMLGRLVLQDASVVPRSDASYGRVLLERACRGRERDACVDLGDILAASGHPREALAAYAQACVGGDAAACKRMDGPRAQTAQDAAAGWHSR